MARVSGHVKSHTKHLLCDHLDHHSATDTTAPAWRESLQQIIDGAVSRMTTAGMTDHEHHIGRRFLRRRIDGERKLAHQEVALLQCGMTNSPGASNR